MAMLTKKKIVKLKGDDLRALQEKIYERDEQCCVFCHTWVREGEKFHHVEHGPNKTDIESNGVILCSKCHGRVHHGPNGEEVNNFCKEYLKNIYGDGYCEV